MSDLDDAMRLGRLEHVAEYVTALRDQERDEPGSVPDLLTEALHAQVLAWGRLTRHERP